MHNPDSVEQITRQENIERQFNRKHIDGYIKKELEALPEMEAKIEQGVGLLVQYMSQDYYASKNARIAQLQGMDLHSLVLSIFMGVAYCIRPELFTAVTSQLASRLKMSDKVAAIQTIAEILAVLCNTDVFDITKEGRDASLKVISRIPLSASLVSYIENSQYLPPMVCRPLPLENNYSSGYLTHNDSLILGSGNHHEGDICLDVINLLNQVPLRLDTEFLSTFEEQPTFALDTQEQRESWDRYKRQSYDFYLMLAQYGNQFYLTHKVDKRGRIYSQGYHVTTQGTAFKKASIELAQEEIINGVPTCSNTTLS